MGKSKKHRRSRSSSTEREEESKKMRIQMESMQKQILNLTNMVTRALPGLEKPRPSKNSDKANKARARNSKEIAINQSQSDLSGDDESEMSLSAHEPPNSEDLPQEYAVLEDEILNKLGEDLPAPAESAVKIHPDIMVRWKNWMSKGLSEETKKALLGKYPRKGELWTEAPKINLEVVPAMSDIATKRDQHFVDAQNAAGTALSSLGSAISMLVADEEEGVDRLTLIEHLCDTGKLLTHVFHQASICRKSFITPLMNKAVKPTLDATVSDEWLYGEKFAEQVKEAKTIEKACAAIKAPDKQPVKRFSQKSQNQGNWKNSSVRARQVGTYQRANRKYQEVRFRQHSRSQRRGPQTGKRPLTQSTNQVATQK